MASPLNDPKLETLLDRLHSQSDVQVDETNAYFARRAQIVTLDEMNSLFTAFLGRNRWRG